MKPLFLLATLIFFATPPSLVLGGISDARMAADAIQDKNYADAVKILDGDLAAMAERDENFSADKLLYLSAIARFHLKNYAAAESSCDRLLKEFPDSEWLHKAVFLKAATRVARNDYERAIGIYETESVRLFAPERKAEIARDLIRFAEIFAKKPASDDVGAPAPDYDRAYLLYSEIIDFDCGLPLRARARYEMTRMRSLGWKYVETESEALAYLKEFDPTWRGLIASPERVTLKKNANALATGKEIAAVRMLHAEALHRLDRRPEADRYLFELIQLIKNGGIKADKALLADATWLRLQTLRRKGGMAYDIDEWKLAAIEYLKADPDHIHANRTAWVLGYLLNRHGKGAEAIKAYRNYLADIYHTGVRAKPLTMEKESPSAFEARKSLAGSHRESAHFAIGEIYFQKGEFDKARKAWSETARLFPNGAKWADCQKGLVEIDYAQLLHNIKQLEKMSSADNEIAQAGKADELIAGFIARYPLDSRIPSLLLEGGMFAFRLGKRLDGENELVRPTPKIKERQDRLFRHAIESWRILLSKYGRSSDAGRAKFLTATLWEERFGDMEKAVGLYQGSKAEEFRTRLVALTSKRLLASCEHAFRLDETPQITLDTRNIESVKVHQYWLDLESYFLKNGNLEQATRLDVDLVEPDRTWEVKIKGEKYHPVSQKIDIPFPQGKPGVCIIKIEEKDYYTTCLVMRSNIDVSVRAGKKEIIAFVMNWATGKPVADVKILLASGEKIIATEKTGRDGVMKRKLADLKDLDRLRVLAVSPDGCATSEQSLTGTFSPPTLKPVAWFHTATAENRPGDMVRLYGVVRDARDGAYVSPKDLDYKLECRTAAGHAIFTSPVKLDAQGGFVTEFKIPEEAKGSLISVVLRNAKKKAAPLFSYSVPITRSARWRAVLELGFDKENIETGDILAGEVSATYRWGAPVSHRRIRVTLPSGNHTEVITDAAGKASFRYDTTGIASGSALTFSASLVGIPCRGAAHTVVVDPLQLYIEAEADKATMTRGEEVSIDVATRDAREKSVGANLTLKLIRLERDEVPANIQSMRVHVKEKLVQTSAIITDAGTGKGRVTLAVKEEGRYILRIEGVDPRGKPSLAETGLTVLGENAPSALVAYHHTQRLYDDGVCQLRVFSKLKSNGRALLTIEGDEILGHRLVDIRPGVNTIDLPLAARHAPVFRAALMCMHERKFYSTEDVITVDRKLHVKTELLNLRDGRAEPGGALDLRVEVSDTAGRPVPALLMLALNSRARSASDAEPLLCSPFQRANRLAEYSMSTSCGFSSVGSQGTILARLKEEEQRLALGNGQAHGSDDLRRLGEDRFKRNDQIRRLLYVGEGSFNLGDYAKAKLSFVQVLQIDRYNAPARRWLERVAAAKSDYYRAAYDHTRAQLLSQVDAQWQMELPNQVQVGGNISNIVTGGNRSGDGAITRNSIDSILNNPNRVQGQGRNSIDFFLNNPDRQSTIRRNALVLSQSGNAFKNNPNRLNQQAFIAGGAFVNYGAELTNNDPFGSQSQTGGDFINPIEFTVIAGIPFIDPFDGSGRAFTGSDRSLGFSRGTDIKLLTAGTSSVKIPLPDQAGKWALSAIAVGKSGRMGIDTRDIETSVPVSMKFQELAEVMAGDVFSPVLAIHRNNADDAKSLHVTGMIKLGGKSLHRIDREVLMKAEIASLDLTIPPITAPASGTLSLAAEVSLNGRNYRAEQSVVIRPEGAPVAGRQTRVLHAGTSTIKLELPDKAEPHELRIRVRKDINTALYQFATGENDSVFGSRIPCRESHSAGQFLAEVSALECFTRQGAKDSPHYQSLLERARWSLNELIEMRHNDGSWSAVRGRSRSDLLVTATACEAIQRWRALGFDRNLSTANTATWLKESLGQLGSGEYDVRCLIQQALSYGKAADFSVCNRLFRDRALLGDAGRALLAQAFLNLERPAFAKSLIEGMNPPEKWTGNADPLTRDPAWLAGRCLRVLAALDMADPALKKQGEALYQTILSRAGADGFTNDFVRGAAVSGLAAWTKNAAAGDCEAEIFVNGKSIRKVASNRPDSMEPISLSANHLKRGVNTIDAVVMGEGTLCLSATLTGFSSEFPKQDGGKFALLERRYYHEGLALKGRPLASRGRSIAREVEFQKIIRVAVRLENRLKDPNELVLIERIPAGFTYLKGSLRGGHSGARLENKHLVVTFRGAFKPRWIHYSMIASHSGVWHQVPAMLLPVYAPGDAVFGSAGALTVLAPGKKSREPYKMTAGEHRELAKLHFECGESKQALDHLAALRKLGTKNIDDAEIARITLWLETARANPDATLLVKSFETLNARMPDLSIPFEKILKVGHAYRELGEFERGHYVFEATLEAGFAQDAYVGAALEDQGRFLDAIDYQKSIWRLYPDHGEITNTWFAMAQELYDRSGKAADMKPRITDEKHTKIKEVDMIRESREMLDQFLCLHPEHPSADEVSYTMANTLFALKDYHGVVAHARRCLQRYPKSKFLGSFRYMEALGSFWLRDYAAAIKAAAEVARGDSADKDLAAFITAQIYHAKGHPLKAIEWYEPIKDRFPDARESIAYFEKKMIGFDEVKVASSGKKATVNLRYRNIKQAQLKIYRVDLMKLFLKQRNLSNITNIQLAGIAPKHELTVKLPPGDMTEDMEKSVSLPMDLDGAYLVICRGDYLYTSGLVLITPLKLEVQEEPEAGSLRVHIKDRNTGKLLDNVHVKAVGGNDRAFQSGETDLRGIWKAENLNGKPTVIARDSMGRYAFFRGARIYATPSDEAGNAGAGQAGPADAKEAAKEVDFKGNLKAGQKELNIRNKKSYEEFRREKGKGVKVNKAMKK